MTDVPVFSPAMYYNLIATQGGYGIDIPPAMDQLPALPEPQQPVGLFPATPESYYSTLTAGFDSYPSPIAEPTFSFPQAADANPYGFSDLSFIY